MQAILSARPVDARSITSAVSSHLVVLLSGLLLFEPVTSAIVLNFVERGGDSVQEAKSWLRLATDFGIWRTYVLMMAKMKVPQGGLQESSRLAVSPVIVLGFVPFARRLGL